MFIKENMDIKEGFTTSSKEQSRSLVRVPMVARTKVLQRNIPED
jgi:hypothetical protein